MGSVPARIGSFEIERELGRGGMGRVYRARHRTLDRIDAITEQKREEQIRMKTR